jgi:hypothetical protein
VLIRLLAVLVLLVGLWAVFRMAMSLRYAKLLRDEERAREESRGRLVIAEVAADSGLELFLEDDAHFHWKGRALPKSQVLGARLRLGGGLIATANRDGVTLPEPPPAVVEEGRGRWEVVLHLQGGVAESIECGALGEGVSRDIAGRVFEAVRRATTQPG